jgi:hypothetical protein
MCINLGHLGVVYAYTCMVPSSAVAEKLHHVTHADTQTPKTNRLTCKHACTHVSTGMQAATQRESHANTQKHRYMHRLSCMHTHNSVTTGMQAGTQCGKQHKHTKATACMQGVCDMVDFICISTARHHTSVGIPLPPAPGEWTTAQPTSRPRC